MKIISIWDVGCGTKIRVAASGKYQVVYSGGCPVEQILPSPLPKLSDEELREFIWDLWVRDYDGDPEENHLTIRIEDEAI